MTRKAEIGIAVAVLVLLILVVLAIIFRQQTKAPGSTPSSTTPVTSTTTPTTTPETTTPVAPPVASPQTTTMIFVERFASYSSESDFANVTDVLPIVTASLGAKLQGIAQDQRTTDTSTAFYGISTKVISQKIVAQTDTTAEVLVSTQRAESIGSPENTTVRYQDITVDLVKEGDTWKVNDFSWGT